MRRGERVYHTLADYDILTKRLEVRHETMTKYVARHAGVLTTPDSNGEYALSFYRNHFQDNALILLDEPENSLSPAYQTEVCDLIQQYARFFGCQFIISTHSPFFLSMKGALIYDLDSRPVETHAWWELSNMRAYYRLFEENRAKFEREEMCNKEIPQSSK